MALQFRRGTNAERITITPAEGEPIWTTDTNQLYIGDGSIPGGLFVTGTGPVGATGATGPTGLQGATGPQGATGAVGPQANTDQDLYTTSSVTFNSVQIGPTANNGFSIVSDSLYVESTTSVVVVAQNGLAVEGNGPGNANFYVDKIHSRFPNSTVTFINTATFEKPVNIEGRVQVGPGNDIGYVSSNGAYNLKLTTNDTQGPGNEIQLVHGDGASIAFLQREGGYRNIGTFGTGTTHLYSDSYTLENQAGTNIASFDSNGSTHYGNYHNFGNTNQNAQLNSQGTGNLTLCSGSDSSNSGLIRISSGGVTVQGPGYTDIADFNTATITFNTNINGVTVNQPSTFLGTLTIASVTIGKNNNAITVPNVVSNSNNVLFNAGLNNGVSMIFGLKNTTGANRSLAFTRNGNIGFFNTASIQTSQAGTGAITIVAGPNTTNGNEGNATIQTSAGLNYVSAQYTGPVMGSFANLPVRLQSDGLDVGTFTTGTTKIVAYNSLDGTVASTLTMAYNSLSMTDNTNAQMFEITNTTATINVPVVSVNSATFSAGLFEMTTTGTNYPFDLPITAKTYSGNSSGTPESVFTMKARGSKGSPVKVEQGDAVDNYQSMAYVGSWGDSSVFPWLAGSPVDGYAYAGFTSRYNQSDTNTGTAVGFNFVRASLQNTVYSAADPEAQAQGSTDAGYYWNYYGGKLRLSSSDYGNFWGLTDTTLRLAPVDQNNVERVFEFQSTTSNFVSPGGVVANTGTFVDSTIQNLTANSTATIQGLKIGYNDGAISIPNVTADPDNMWIRTTGNSGSIILTCKTSAGVDRNFAWANSRLRFDASQAIYPNPTTGAMSVNGGTVGGVDGTVDIKDYSANNAITIDPAQGVNITTTATYGWQFGLEGLATLPVLSAGPATPTIGMVAVADGVTWDPATYSTTTAYVTFYNGTAWTALG